MEALLNLTSMLKPCEFCGTAIPQFDLSDKAWPSITARFHDSSPTLVRAEIKYWTDCLPGEAELFYRHLQKCIFSWPFSEEESQILDRIDRVFANAKKPDRFTNCPCEECAEYEKEMQTMDRNQFTYWYFEPSHIYLLDPTGGAYFFPSLARLALRSDPTAEDGSAHELCRYLSSTGWEKHFADDQKQAIAALLSHLGEFHPRLTFNTDFNNSVALWQAEKA